MQAYNCVAFDLGAGSGRAILGTYDQGKIKLTEVHRFENPMIMVHGHHRWDTNHLHKEILNGLRKTIHVHNIIPDSIAIDTWGVDFTLLDTTGEILEQPFAYRDSLTENAMKEVFEVIPGKDLYMNTGIQFMPFNSLFQLWAINRRYPLLMARANKMLFMPDYLSYKLTGEIYAEHTIASTSQMLNPQTGSWNQNLLVKLGLPIDMLTDLVDPGTQIGVLSNNICSQFGIPPIPIIAVGAHDTASAVAAIPAQETNWAYISSGTWSLMGIETDQAIINEKAYEYSFTNEGGVNNKNRFLKNINGLWLLQQCKKIWDQHHGPFSFEKLIALAEKEKAFSSLIDVDNPRFSKPEDMTQEITSFCKETGQTAPQSPGAFTRCILESLALKYRYTLEQLLEVADQRIEMIHIIGGGSKNQLLCQFTSNATGLPVEAGPAEGTAMGNLLVQVMAAGEVRSLDELRCVVKNSVSVVSYQPQDQTGWQEAFDNFSRLINQSKK